MTQTQDLPKEWAHKKPFCCAFVFSPYGCGKSSADCRNVHPSPEFTSSDCSDSCSLKCPYFHASSADKSVDVRKKKIQQACIPYFAGKCTKTAMKCQYVHVDRNNVIPKCKFFKEGRCERGDMCTQLHIRPGLNLSTPGFDREDERRYRYALDDALLHEPKRQRQRSVSRDRCEETTASGKKTLSEPYRYAIKDRGQEPYDFEAAEESCRLFGTPNMSELAFVYSFLGGRQSGAERTTSSPLSYAKPIDRPDCVYSREDMFEIAGMMGGTPCPLTKKELHDTGLSRSAPRKSAAGETNWRSDRHIERRNPDSQAEEGQISRSISEHDALDARKTNVGSNGREASESWTSSQDANVRPPSIKCRQCRQRSEYRCTTCHKDLRLCILHLDTYFRSVDEEYVECDNYPMGIGITRCECNQRWILYKGNYDGFQAYNDGPYLDR